jgi:hypothetical protein
VDDNTSTPVLIREAMQVGFLIEQLWQTEELASLTLPSMNVKSKTSLSSNIINVWMGNQRKNGAP